MTSENTSAGDPFPDETPVLVRYPRDKQEERGDRETRPWLPGYIVQRCGPDEWQVCVEAREVAVTEDGSTPPADAPDDELLFPCCYRDSSELRPSDS